MLFLDDIHFWMVDSVPLEQFLPNILLTCVFFYFEDVDFSRFFLKYSFSGLISYITEEAHRKILEIEYFLHYWQFSISQEFTRRHFGLPSVLSSCSTGPVLPCRIHRSIKYIFPVFSCRCCNFRDLAAFSGCNQRPARLLGTLFLSLSLTTFRQTREIPKSLKHT